MWWVLIVIILLVGLIVWANCVRGMNLKDRIEVALEIAHTARFAPAEGFADASREDPDLVGWLRAGNDCVMLFRSVEEHQIQEVVDVASPSFRPGLVVRYIDGHAVSADGKPIEGRLRNKADQLLRETRQLVAATSPVSDFGFRE